jgi:hypothetical protein
MERMSLKEQDRLIRRQWPFRTILLGNGIGLWRGQITALSCPYEISILYVTRHFQPGFEWRHSYFPEVRVLAPQISRRPEEPELPIPHVYDENSVARPPLCLFDPAEDGWLPSQAIAETTIPLAADWLRFYEAWQATGIWMGGGRDHVVLRPAETSGQQIGCGRRHAIADGLGLDSSRSVIAAMDGEMEKPVSRLQLMSRLTSFAASRTSCRDLLIPTSLAA